MISDFLWSFSIPIPFYLHSLRFLTSNVGHFGVIAAPPPQKKKKKNAQEKPQSWKWLMYIPLGSFTKYIPLQEVGRWSIKAKIFNLWTTPYSKVKFQFFCLVQEFWILKKPTLMLSNYNTQILKKSHTRLAANFARFRPFSRQHSHIGWSWFARSTWAAWASGSSDISKLSGRGFLAGSRGSMKCLKFRIC